jgi:hypothetical protein
MFEATTLTLTVVLFASSMAACGGSARASSSAEPVDVAGPVKAGYRGPAYAVPESGNAGPHVDAVRVVLKDAAGKTIGNDYVAAGKPWTVDATKNSDQVAIQWAGGATAYAPRRDFWVMPDWLGLKDMTVEINGKKRLLGYSGIRYHRGSVALFDDPTTPQFEGIDTRTRQWLQCKVPTWGIGGQTFIVDLVEDGVHRRDKSLVDKGVIGLDWGISVPIDTKAVHVLHRDCDGKTLEDYGGTHQTTQWLESLGRAVYLLASSPWAGEYAPKIHAYIARIEKIATLLSETKNYRTWEGHITYYDHTQFTHRTYMMADALGQASTLTDNRADAQRWAAMAEQIARRGLSLQRPDGVNPERGGYDVEYQMYGTWLSLVYRATLPDGSSVKADLDRMTDKSLQWYETRIKPNGQINMFGTTRVCRETLWTSGKPSGAFDPGEAIRVFLLWGHLTANSKYVADAQRMDRGNKAYGNRCPAASVLGRSSGSPESNSPQPVTPQKPN